MLISRRREGETIHIGEGIEIRIVTIRKNKVVFGIIAPREVKIATGKLTDEALANTMAAINSSNVSHFFPLPAGQQPGAELERVISLFGTKASEPNAAVDDKKYGKPE
jgi:carbon storage regulator CsrA